MPVGKHTDDVTRVNSPLMNDILATSLRLYGRYFVVILGLVLTIGLPCQVLASYAAYEIYGRENIVAAAQSNLLIELVFGIVVTGGILQALFIDRMDRRARFLECLSMAITHWFRLAWTNFIATLLIVFSATLIFLPIGPDFVRWLFLIPAIYLSVRFSLALVVVVAEDEWGWVALRRSAALTSEKFWTVLGLGLFVFVPIQALGILGVRMLQTNPAYDTWLFTSAFGLVLKLIAAIIPITFFVLYEHCAESASES